MDEKDRQSLDECRGELTFDDDITEFCCVQCKNVAVYHFTSDCNHVFCRDCQEHYGDDVYYKCPKCQATISAMSPSHSTFEKLLYSVAYCPNKKNGCDAKSTLNTMPGHLRQCRHIVATQLNNEPETKQIPVFAATTLNATIHILELQTQMKDMQREIQMLKAKLGNQQTVKRSPVEEIDNLTKDSHGSSQQNKLLMSSVQNNQKEMEEIQSRMTSGSSGTEANNEQLHLNRSFNGMPNKEYNILLLGQPGVGKSTLINAIANYLTYPSLEDALTAEPVCLSLCQFNIYDKSFDQRILKFGHDTNEEVENVTQSATMVCRAYKFPVNDFVIQLIDTPGITGNLERDRPNIQQIFTFISQYNELHAIFILLKPNEMVWTFQSCITQLLCELHESVSKNIVFLFTNSWNTFDCPGNAIAPLKKILARIKDTPPCIEIPFHEENTFCLDSEPFRFLVAAKDYINFSEGDIENFHISWKKAVEECYRMIRYVVEGPDGRGLAPHCIKDMVSINEARRAIVNLSRPLAEMAKHLLDNIHALNLKLKEIDECKSDLYNLKEILYIPIIILQVKELYRPRTVCMGDKCRQMDRVGTLYKYNYPVECHDPCYLEDDPLYFVGSEQLQKCGAMDRETGMCRQCRCHYSKLLHIYYESEVMERQEVDRNINSQLQTEASAIKAVEYTMKSLKGKVKEYEKAHVLLNKFTAKLAVFLRQNALVATNDAIEEYLKQEIKNEKSLNAAGANNADLIQRLDSLLQQYNKEKETFEKAVNGSGPNERITSKEVMEVITQLTDMNICGETISEMVEAKCNSSQKETERRYISTSDFYYGRRGLGSAFVNSWLQRWCK